MCIRDRFYGVFLVDLVYSLGIVTKVRKFAVENEILIKYEELKKEIRQNTEESKEKVRFLLSFRSATPLKEHLARYLDLQQAFDLDKMTILNEDVYKRQAYDSPCFFGSPSDMRRDKKIFYTEKRVIRPRWFSV